MDQDLLHCSICPKQPSFSDTSHLLTHVSSKGHLSEWHKLNVRSYQDIAAAVALTRYNQWCQQHDMDRLLSDRMQIKEDKKARKKGAANTRQDSASNHIPIDDTLLNPPMPPKRAAKQKTQAQKKRNTSRQQGEYENENDEDFSPVTRPRRRTHRAQVCSPVKDPHLSDSAYPSLDDCLAENDPPAALQVLATPEHIKLKGIVWPGMDLFDAATQEMQQKRNQKKDASILRRMEKLAGLVVPAEVVFSPNGDNVLKARHIDDLEDASSLIEGETPVPKAKQPRTRKRKPLAEKDVNAPRLVKRKAKASSPKQYEDLPFAHGLPPLPQLPSSSIGESYGVRSRFFPIEGDEDIKPSFEAGFPRKRPPPQFEIFADGSPRQHSTTVLNVTRNPLQTVSRGYGQRPVPNLPKVSASWLQPQYQSALQYTDPYTTYRPVARQYHAFYEPAIANENMPPMAEPAYLRGQAANPLSWKSPVRPIVGSGLSPSGSPFGSFFGMFPGGSPSDDPFVINKNPLAGALVRLEDEGQSDADSGNSRSPTDTESAKQAEV
ncbi:hypothetical protein H2200_009145 [Cladophialophora chaetospira]|uniref:Uncharacterized protein n=1 Tax=Cladophialophora chaetospira TaxID=386627 RepID=A0AA38X3J3_9EURO|nr:hypothetical protein H2200_009145 [Cladophialophora chaetospira]